MLADAIQELENAQRKFDQTWRNIFTEFDRAQGAIGQPARFICDTGYTLSREVSNYNAPPVLDPALLEQTLIMSHSPAEFNKLWDSLTDKVETRTLSTEKLERALKSRRISAELVAKAMVPPKSIASRHRRKATKEDMAYLTTGVYPEVMEKTS
jgi:hypothetical protein